MRNYVSLAAHNAECNDFFYKLQDCQYEHPFRKYTGFCSIIDNELRTCLKQQRKIKSEKNHQIAKERRNRLREIQDTIEST